MGWYKPARLYDIFGELLSVLNIFSIALCVFLTVKGLYLPSTSDSGSNGSLVFDFYWGALTATRFQRLSHVDPAHKWLVGGSTTPQI
jgi:hypothetical protein